MSDIIGKGEIPAYDPEKFYGAGHGGPEALPKFLKDPYDPNDKDAYKKIRDFSNKLIDKTLELKGTITGEHGVGLHKKSYLLKEHPDNIPLMKTIKRSLDPNNIMNPGKIFDLN